MAHLMWAFLVAWCMGSLIILEHRYSRLQRRFIRLQEQMLREDREIQALYQAALGHIKREERRWKS